MQIRFTRIFVPLLTAGLLAACGAALPQGPTERISAQTHEAVLPYSFLSCSTDIGAAEQKRIRTFLDKLGLTSQDTLVVSVPKNRLPERDAGRRKTLSQIFAAYPARVRFIQDDDLRELPQSEPQGIIRVVRVTGVNVTCKGGTGEAGCASARNLAAMIAYPADVFMPDKGARYLPPAKTQQAGFAP
ncbi:hypothetical protein M3484_11190 [Pseudomonas sp. GX19020]|uniref:hypothetical protein n=1 Tax=Pseudomonas sp. GX19020 TaxID=2942277 RepID=UPI002018E3DC|nr:hypothetical protein [Pseudomonas sp. GX19020]MCL4067135.1 hypothetical protein [Pseudomonas sp. GX19020]